MGSKPKVCPVCKEYLNEDKQEYWCSYCDHVEGKQISPNWSLDDE